MALITITLEVNDNAPILDTCSNIKDSLHEILCSVIHEGCDESLNWLTENILDIDVL